MEWIRRWRFTARSRIGRVGISGAVGAGGCVMDIALAVTAAHRCSNARFVAAITSTGLSARPTNTAGAFMTGPGAVVMSPDFMGALGVKISKGCPDGDACPSCGCCLNDWHTKPFKRHQSVGKPVMVVQCDACDCEVIVNDEAQETQAG